MPRPSGVALPGQPATLAALQAMQSIILSECLVGGVTPFAALAAADASRYGVTNAVFVASNMLRARFSRFVFRVFVD